MRLELVCPAGTPAALRDMGVRHFRLSPRDCDMVALARLHRAVLNGRQDAGEAAETLRALTDGVVWQNGFLHGREGLAWVGRPLRAA